MSTIRLTVGDEEREFQIDVGGTYKLSASRDADGKVLLSCELVPPTVMRITGTCIDHRKPLFDNEEFCVECYEELDAQILSDV